jgi:hypothetical protein
MFIIAATIGYAKKHGLEYHIPAHTQDDSKWKPMFTHLENPRYDPSLPKLKIEERSFSYNYLPSPPVKGCNIELSGYFQSHKYFSHCLDEVRKAFNIPYKYRPGCTAIHVRLGDYKNLQEFHPVVSREYLQEAMMIMISKKCHHFIGFSDNQTEAFNLVDAEHFIPEPSIIVDFSREADVLEDLSRGASCDHIIGSNSSFSLWMYYLNPKPDKIGIFPKRWFGPKLPHDTKDLYPDNCIII